MANQSALSKFNANERRTIEKRLRQLRLAPENAEALALRSVKTGHQHTEYSTYSRSHHYYAETLEDLLTRCGDHGEAAIVDVRYGAIRSWLMGLHGDTSLILAHGYQQASEALRIVGDEELYQLGCPTSEGKARSSAFEGLTPDYRCEVIRICIDTLADFKRAGSPGLSGLALAKRCKSTQQYITACDGMAKASHNQPTG